MFNNNNVTIPMLEVFTVFEKVLPKLEWGRAYTIKDWMDSEKPGFWDRLSDDQKEAIELTFELYIRAGRALEICIYKEDEYPPRYITY